MARDEMRAIEVREFGDAGVLQPARRPVPRPGKGQARVRVEAAGVNFIDVYHRTGAYRMDLPMVPGLEGAGVVEELGEAPDGGWPEGSAAEGERVAWALGLGSYAEQVALPAAQLVPVPEGLDLRVAAAVMLQGMTAHYLSHSTWPLEPGDVALVHAGAGGVGHLLIQLARRRGARVLTTVSTQEKAQLAREAGAHEAILYTEKDFQKEVHRLTDGRGVDVVYDSVGRTTFDKSLRCLRPRGLLVLFGQSSGAVEAFDPQRLNQHGSLFLTRPTLKDHTADRQELLGRARDLTSALVDGSLRVRIDQSFPLDEAAHAHRYLEERRTRGKVLLQP